MDGWRVRLYVREANPLGLGKGQWWVEPEAEWQVETRPYSVT